MTRYDVAVIGAGVVGTAIARELSRYDLRCVILEAGSDVGVGTSKANTAIRHTGFDAKPGSLESTLLAAAREPFDEYARAVGIPIERTGALLVAWSDTELGRLDDIAAAARANGYQRARAVPVAELYEREPHLGPGAFGALEIPDEGIVCPFTTPLAFATEAVLNGVTLLCDTRVMSIGTDPEGAHVLRHPRGEIEADWVVNAAGLDSARVDAMLGHHDFTVRPRRGELVVFDKLAGSLVSHVLLPVPTEVSKGVLVAPTVFGNVLLGPTAEPVDDPAATETTASGLSRLWDAGAGIVPDLFGEEVTATYSGLRAATEQADYRVRCRPGERSVTVGGIRSTGLSSAFALGSYVVELLADAGLALREVGEHRWPDMPPIGAAMRRPYQDPQAIAADPDAGRVVCHCERVSAAEIAAATVAPVPARDLDGLRRRTRAMLGRCQGFYCGPRVTSLLAESGRLDADELLGREQANNR